MKKLFTVILTLATVGAVTFLTSCGASGGGPGKAAEQYSEYLAAEDYDKFIEGIYIPKDTPADEVEQGKAMLRSLFVEKGSQQFAAKGGLKSVEVISEEIASDGQTAKVDLKYTYGNGETSDETVDMRLDEAGKWKMEMSK